MSTIVYGSEIAAKIKDKIKHEVDTLVNDGKRLPTLCVILVGDNPASLSYVSGKDKACKEVGFGSKMIKLPEDTSMRELKEIIDKCNADNTIDGILVQLPLPKQLDEKEVIRMIDPNKDVDGLNPINVGKLYLGEDGFVPCTALGVMEILKEMGIKLQGKKAVVIGRSKLVGNPVAKLLLNENATVTMTHSKTEDLKSVCKEADVLVVAIGKPKYLTNDFVKEGAYVVDVGINRVDGKIVGDVDFENVKDHCTAITPVPKGVGPMTICMLLNNTLDAYHRHGK